MNEKSKEDIEWFKGEVVTLIDKLEGDDYMCALLEKVGTDKSDDITFAISDLREKVTDL
jgi:hypothetical protein